MTKEEMTTKRIAREALRKEFGFTVSTLKDIVLMEEGIYNNSLYVLFRVGDKVYRLENTTITRA